MRLNRKAVTVLLTSVLINSLRVLYGRLWWQSCINNWVVLFIIWWVKASLYNLNLTQPNLALHRLGSQFSEVTQRVEYSIPLFTHTYTLMRCVLCKKKCYAQMTKSEINIHVSYTVTALKCKASSILSSCSIQVSAASSSLNKTSVFPENYKNRVTSPSNPPLRGYSTSSFL